MPKRNNTTIQEKAHALKLIDDRDHSLREASGVVGIPKSTLHDNLSKFRAEVSHFEVNPPPDASEKLVRAALILTFDGKTSARDCALTISKLWRVEVSHQTVLNILDQSSMIATEINRQFDLSAVTCAAFDEIFQKNQPILGFVDPVTGTVQLKGESSRSGEAWIKFLKQLEDRGLAPTSVTTDGGQGMLKGIGEVFPDTAQIRDLFHVMRKLTKSGTVMEGKCYGLIAAVDKLSVSDSDGERLVLKRKMEIGIDLFDRYDVLAKSFHDACYLGNTEEDGKYISSENLATIVQEIGEVLTKFADTVNDHRAIREAKTYVVNGMDGIVAYKRLIENSVRHFFGDTFKDLILNYFAPLMEYLDQYARAHDSVVRQAFWGKKIAAIRKSLRDYSCADQQEVDNAINRIASILDQAKKSNSLIEAVNSVVRTHLRTYKSIPRWFCPLFTCFWNHRRFNRGKRSGYAPRELLERKRIGDDWADLIVARFPLESLRSGLPISTILPAA